MIIVDKHTYRHKNVSNLSTSRAGQAKSSCRTDQPAPHVQGNSYHASLVPRLHCPAFFAKNAGQWSLGTAKNAGQWSLGTAKNAGQWSLGTAKKHWEVEPGNEAIPCK